MRVFVPTYRRPGLLPRALASLQAQTFPDWICEVHNDDPADPFPAELVTRLADPRITLVNHARNLGGTATFNLFFRATTEPFYSLLEDDNWWEPDFLATLLATAAAHPTVTVFWANMRIWDEQLDGSFRDTGRTVRPVTGEESRPIPWGGCEQILGAVHSNGAALFRSRPGDDFSIPPVPFAVVEMFRERLFPYPLVFVPRPLAHFSVTRQSERSRNPAEWAVLQTMLAATFLKHAGCPPEVLDEIWSAARAARPPDTAALLFASMLEPGCRGLRRHARVVDWWRLFRSSVRRPAVFLAVLRSRRRHRDWWDWLDRHTAACFRRWPAPAISPQF